MENIILRFFFSLQQDFSCDRCHISHLGNNRHNGSNQLFIIKYKLNCIQYFTLYNFHSIANNFAPYWIRPVIVVQEKSTPLKAPSYYLRSWFWKLKNLTIWECFHMSSNFSVNFFTISPPIYCYVKWNPNSTPWIKIWTIINLHSLRMFSRNFKIFWPNI